MPSRPPSSFLARLCLARDVVECPECGEPEPFLGLFLKQGRAGAVRLSRLEWVTRAPAAFARWAARVCPRWRRAGEFYVNHCGPCGAALADPLGFRGRAGWLCDTGIDVAVTGRSDELSVEGFSPGAVVVPGGKGLWEEFLRLTSRDFRRRFRESPRFEAPGRGGERWLLAPAPAPHRWRLTEPAVRGRKHAVDEAFFTFARAKEAARARFAAGPFTPDLRG
jgi:hypothetical protein